MRVSKPRIIYIVSLAILGTIIAFVASNVFRQTAIDGEYSAVLREGIIETEDECILEVEIVNHEGIDQHYTIGVVVDGRRNSERILIPDGKMYTYIYHVYRDTMTEGCVSVTIYKEGETTPFEEYTYYINFDEQ